MGRFRPAGDRFVKAIDDTTLIATANRLLPPDATSDLQGLNSI